MTNGEIRALAREKQKGKGLTAAIFLSILAGVLVSVPQFLLTGLRLSISLAATVLSLIVASLVSTAGLVRVSMAVWNGGAARVSELFAYLANARLFARGCTVALMEAALVLLMQIPAILAGTTYGPKALAVLAIAQLILMPLFVVAGVCVGFLYYAIEALPGEPLRAVIPRGLKLALKNLGRLIGMAFAVAWQPLLIYLGCGLFIMLFMFLFASTAAVVPGVLLLLALIGALVWAYGPYIALAYAGLAVELVAVGAGNSSAEGSGGAGDAPEQPDPGPGDEPVGDAPEQTDQGPGDEPAGKGDAHEQP